MIRALALVAALSLLAPRNAAADHERFFEKETIDVATVTASIPAAPGDAAWQKVPAKSFSLAPQRSIRLNDKEANAALDRAKSFPISVRAASNGREIALRVEWPDETRDTTSSVETNAFGDAVAIELPMKFGAGERLPHVGMGDRKSHVLVDMQRAGEKSTLVNEYVAAGFGSLTRTAGGTTKMQMEYDAAHKSWSAVFSRPIELPGHSMKQGLVPIAFAAWNGSGHERASYKSLTGWKFLRFAQPAIDPAYLATMSWGADGSIGDPAKGKVLVESVCIACHRVGDKAYAPEGLDPELTGIGAIASWSYLRDSIVNPSAVVVENLQLNRHYNKAATPDAFQAFPNNDAYSWFTTDASGERVSKMPSFGYLSPEDQGNVVAYLKSLEP